MRIYISGKITGLPPEIVSETFTLGEQDAEERYKHLTHTGMNIEIVNPIKLDHSYAKSLEEKGFTQEQVWHIYMSKCIEALLTCNAVYMLKNWGDSRGARIEYAIAKELGLTIEYEKWAKTSI